MTLERYVVIRTLAVTFALLWMGWLYFSRPEVLADAGGGKPSCHPIAWRYQGGNYPLYSGFDVSDSERIHEYLGKSAEGFKSEEEYYRRVEENIGRSYEIARSDHHMFINVAAVVLVSLFLTVPKPKRTGRSERNDSESGSNGFGDAEDSGNAETGGAQALSACSREADVG